MLPARKHKSPSKTIIVQQLDSNGNLSDSFIKYKICDDFGVFLVKNDGGLAEVKEGGEVYRFDDLEDGGRYFAF